MTGPIRPVLLPLLLLLLLLSAPAARGQETPPDAASPDAVTVAQDEGDHSAVPAPSPESSAALPFLPDLETARRESAARGRPVAAFIVADWSAHSDRLLASLYADAAARARLAEFPLILVPDDEPGRAFRDRYGVREFPTTLLLAADLTEVARVGGAPPVADWLEAFETAVRKLPKR